MKNYLKKRWALIVFAAIAVALFLVSAQCGAPGGPNSDHLYYIVDRKAGVACFSPFATFSSIGCLPIKDTNIK